MDELFSLLFGTLVVGVAGWTVVTLTGGTTERLKAARAAYDASLAELKLRPADPDLRARTLALGRAYSNLTRSQRGVTVYDEVALANDIGAACAGAAPAGTPPTPAPAEARLAQLTDLHGRGLVTDEEHRAQRARILADL